ncbi:MAG: tRNA uracil 4-sulfurtransferase ThiI [candidate division WOR-3 bacterium]
MKTYLIRLGETLLKGKKTRLNFLNILINNIKDAFYRENINYENLHHEWSRIFFNSNDERCEEILKRIFGIVSFSKTQKFEWLSFDDLLLKGKDFFLPLVKNKKFAVRARVTGANLSSREIEIKLGSLLYEFSKGVDLENPEITCFVEVRGKNVYFFNEIIKCEGGLPLGSEGKVISLLSGGYDSAVASFLMAKRGVHVDFLFYNLGGFSHLNASFNVAKILWKKWGYGIKQKFFVCDLRPIVSEIKNKINEKYWNIVLKRIMFKIADRFVKENDYEGFITGSSVGQVSSQTLRNLRISAYGISSPIFHPLLGFDKTEIIEISKKIGTYEISEKVKEYCAIVPERPVTRPSLEEVLREEEKIPEGLIDYVFSYITEFDLNRDIEDLYISVEEIEENSIIIDIRENKEEKIKGAIEMDFFDLLTYTDNLSKEKKYIIICEFGLRSEEAAKRMKEMGFNVKNFLGGFDNFKKKFPEFILKEY